MPAQGHHLLAGYRVPDSCNAVPAGGGKPTAVGAERDVKDIFLGAQDCGAFAGPGVPQANRMIQRARRDERAIARDVDWVDFVAVTA
jgi:hypothetical protein